MTRKKTGPGADKGGESDDSGLFRRLFADARRVLPEKVPPRKQRPPARARFTRSDERRALAESLETGPDTLETDNGDALSYRHSGVHPRLLRRLARGAISVQAETDLHGMTRAQARDALYRFVDEARTRGHTCVRVIHGKGLGSGLEGPVIKSRIGTWLRRRSDVLAYASAPPVHGGTGALYVLLRKSGGAKGAPDAGT